MVVLNVILCAACVIICLLILGSVIGNIISGSMATLPEQIWLYGILIIMAIAVTSFLILLIHQVYVAIKRYRISRTTSEDIRRYNETTGRDFHEDLKRFKSLRFKR